MRDPDEYLNTIESIAATVPYEDDNALHRRVHDLWSHYADKQMYKRWTLKRCLENCAAQAKRKAV